jgi:hypothetical protein
MANYINMEWRETHMPGHYEEQILNGGTICLWSLSMEHDLCHPPGT